jgi:hypothetical protein
VPVYGWFKGVFHSPDLKEQKALLDARSDGHPMIRPTPWWRPEADPDPRGADGAGAEPCRGEALVKALVRPHRW